MSVAYLEPASLEEALARLGELGDDATVVAGGTAVAIMLRQRLLHPEALLSLGRLPELRSIERDGDAIAIGALVTHREVELSPLVREAAPLVAEAFRVVANVRVRSVATVGGVLAEADYASDPPCALLALDADVLVRGPSGERRVPIGEFLVGFYETALEPDELVVGLQVPAAAAGARWRYEKFRTRSSEDRPCVGVAATLAGEELRVAVGAASETPLRLPDVERTVRGSELSDEAIDHVAESYANELDALDDMRGSAWYRREMTRLWVRRAIEALRG